MSISTLSLMLENKKNSNRIMTIRSKPLSINLLHLNTSHSKASGSSSLFDKAFNENNIIGTSMPSNDSHKSFKRLTCFITKSVLVSRSVLLNTLTIVSINNEAQTKQNYDNQFSTYLGSLAMANVVSIEIESTY